MKYPDERKQAVIAKMMPPHNKSIAELAEEERILHGHALQLATRNSASRAPASRRDTTPVGWSSSDKFAAVLETVALNEEASQELLKVEGGFRSERLSLELPNSEKKGNHPHERYLRKDPGTIGWWYSRRVAEKVVAGAGTDGLA